MSKVRMALLYSSGSLYVYQLISLFFSMYVARVLTPAEIGLYAIAASITMVSGELKVLGTSDYLIRQKNVTKEMIKASLGLSLLVSGSIGALLVIFSQLIVLAKIRAQEVFPTPLGPANKKAWAMRFFSNAFCKVSVIWS